MLGQHFEGTFDISVEGENAEFVQLITGTKFASFLKPNMASKNDARQGIELSQLLMIRCHVWHRFLKPCLASKRFQFSYLQSLTQLRHLRLQLNSRWTPIHNFAVDEL